MSFQERRALISLISTLLIAGLYSAYMLQRQPSADPYAPETFQFWGTFFVLLIPVSIASRIVINIVFMIMNTIVTRETETEKRDERDNLIELKATRNSLYSFAIGVILAMGALALNQPPNVMFILLIIAGVTAEVVSELSQFYFYRRGY